LSIDRFISWEEPQGEQGSPSIERVAQTARDFLGPRWTVEIDDAWIHCVSDETPTFHLRSEFLAQPDNPHMQTRLRGTEEFFEGCKRGFSIFFKGEHGEEQTSVITGIGNDAFSNALADRFAKIIARWWGGTIEWPT